MVSPVQVVRQQEARAVQFEALLSNNLWLRNAAHANQMARLLADELATVPQVRITQEVQSNAVFAVVPGRRIPALQQRRFFWVWDEDTSEVRWMTAFDTTEQDVREFVSFVRDTLSDSR